MRARHAVSWCALSLALVLGAPATSGASPTGPRAPVIAESFTHLPCTHKTQLGLDGCAERVLLHRDALLNAQVKLLFGLLSTQQAQKRFVAVEDEWLRYRTADCTNVEAIFQGGSIGPMEYADCEANDDALRSDDLHDYFLLLEEGTANPPRWP